MIKYSIFILYILLLGCSFDTKSGIWTEEKKISELNKNISEVFKKKEIIQKEFNSKLLIKINDNPKNHSDELKNKIGIKDFEEKLNKSSRFRFSKINNFAHFEPELTFDGENFIFFDHKGNLIKFNDNFDIIWKKNFYSNQEKKLSPILTLSNDKNFLVVVDNISKVYVVDLKLGNLVWSKYNQNPFNSQVKIFDNKIFAVDINNVLRCFSLIDGTEIWRFNSENTFLKSSKRNSLVINNGIVYFNNSIGDIVAVDIDKGSLIWQTPTQTSAIYENAFGLVMSDLVINKESLMFSNNLNEFYSINLKNGVINWKQKINSSVRPAFYNDQIFTVSNEGYFFVIDSKTGNILRITDIFNFFKIKNRNKINPVGFVVGKTKILLSTNNGRLIKIDIEKGTVDLISKIDNEKISRPFVFNKKIILLKDNSIIRLN